MSVVGADFGSLNTVIAVARNRGVDVVGDPSETVCQEHTGSFNCWEDSNSAQNLAQTSFPRHLKLHFCLDLWTFVPPNVRFAPY
jgi:hypothetical protein